ncbi:MAG TPA: hypothetical protein DDZ39_10615 [Flavobacteriaceae bacterium]|jgi:hypothetical protein|nr:hypothetical protein [Flavobacteriaceae bacterium]HBS11546.1 hypothetical protein [Flavobacteriaceae bacterium]
MKTKEFQFLEEKIFNLIKDNDSVKIEAIFDYLDYLNKVRYSKKEISPVLDKLVLENKIIFNENIYSLDKKLLK